MKECLPAIREAAVGYFDRPQTNNPPPQTREGFTALGFYNSARVICRLFSGRRTAPHGATQYLPTPAELVALRAAQVDVQAMVDLLARIAPQAPEGSAVFERADEVCAAPNSGVTTVEPADVRSVPNQG